MNSSRIRTRTKTRKRKSRKGQGQGQGQGKGKADNSGQQGLQNHFLHILNCYKLVWDLDILQQAFVCLCMSR